MRVLFEEGERSALRSGAFLRRASLVVALWLLPVALANPACAQGVGFHTLAPCRLADTRSTDGPALQHGVTRDFQIEGDCGVPAMATAISLNVTIVSPAGAGHLTIYETGTAAPSTSTINFTAGQTRANNTIVTLYATGMIAIAPVVTGGGTVHVILDTAGYFAPGDPVAAGDTASVAEDASATTIDVLANDSDPDGDPFTITSVTQPLNGEVLITSGGADLTYQPDPDYCNTPPGSALDTFTYTLTPGGSTATVSVTVNCVNDQPTDLTLPDDSIGENLPVGTAVGTFVTTDPDAGDTFTYTLVNGTGDADNASFSIDGDALESVVVFDQETDDSYSIRVRTTDAGGLFIEQTFIVTITGANDPPTDLALVDQSVDENQPVATVVGILSTTDADVADSHTYSLVAGTGDTDNAAFTIAGDELRTAAVFDFETKSSYSIRIRTTDSPGAFLEEVFLISIADLNEAPTAIALSPQEVEENSAAGTTAGTLSSTDQDSGDSHSYTLVSGTGDADNASFQISGTQLQTTAVFDFETKSTYSVRIQTDDGNGGTHAQTFTITVTDVNDAPADITLSSSTLPENNSAGATIGTLTADDQDDTTHTFTLASGTGDTDNASFSITGTQLSTLVAFDYEAKSSYSIRVKADDGAGGTYEKGFTISVGNVNEAPLHNVPGLQTFDEDTPRVFSAANGNAITISDPDAGASAVEVTLTATNGTLTLNGTAGLTITPPADGTADTSITFSGALSDVNARLDGLSFQPDPHYNGSASISVTTSDLGNTGTGGAQSAGPSTISLTISAVNDVPSFTVQEPAFVLFGASGQQTSTVANSISAGAANESSQVLTFNVTANSNPTLFAAGPVVAADGTLTWTPAPGQSGTSLVTITLSDDNATPGDGSDDQTSAPQSFTVAIEKAPEVTGATPAEGSQAVTPGEKIVINFSEPVAYDGGAFAINCGGAVAFTTAAGPAATYTLDPVSSLPATNCTVTVDATKIHDSDGYDGPDGLAANFVLTFTVNTPPNAVDDSNFALGNVTLTVPDAQGVLANDTDPDPGAVLTVDLTGNPYTTSSGAKVTFTSGGGYTYLSEAGEQNIASDTVTYTVKDNNNATDTATLTINLGPRYIFVGDTGVAGDGRDSSPFHTLQAAEGGSANGDTIVVKSGTYDSTADHITLKLNQKLIGQGIAANLTHTGHGPGTFTILTPGTAPVIDRGSSGDAVTLGTSANNTIRGVAIETTNGRGIVGNGFGTLTVSDNVMVNATGGTAVDLVSGAVAATFANTSASSGTNPGLVLNSLSGTLTIQAGTISTTTGTAFSMSGGDVTATYAGSLSTTGSSLVNIASRSGNTVTLSGALSGSGTILVSGSAGTVVFSGSQSLSTGSSHGVHLLTNTGAVNFTGGALQITTTSGAGFWLTGGGSAGVTGSANTISTGSGIPLRVVAGANINGSGMTFRSISGNGAASGIVLANTTNPLTITGTGSAGSGGTLQSISGSAVSLSGTSAVNLSHLTINGAAQAFEGTSFGTLTLRDVSVSATTALNMNGGAINDAPSATAFSSLSASSTGAFSGVLLTGVTGTFSSAAGTIAAASSSAALGVSGGSFTATFGNSFSQSGTAAVVDITNHATGTLTFNGNVGATAGTGIQFNNADGTYRFLGASNVINAANAGVDVLGGSGGTFEWGSGTAITATASAAFRINGSTPASVTCAGSITANSTRAVEVSFTSPATGNCGTSTFSGTITSSGSGAQGILVDRCSSGSVTFSGSAQTLSTGTSAGVTISGNGAAVAFTGGNLDVTTTTGKAFTATGGGSVRVAGSGNTLTTESDGSPAGGMLLEVVDTAIATGGLNFVSITGHGASSTAKAIHLKNAGTGGLTVTGTGTTAGSGGTITNYVQKGIHVENTSNVSLTNMNFTGNGTANLDDFTVCGQALNGTNSNCAAGIDLQSSSSITLTRVVVSGGAQIGINGRNVTTLTLTDVEVANAGNQVGEEGIQFHNLHGTSTWLNLNAHDNAAAQVEIQNNATVVGSHLNLTMTSPNFENAVFQSNLVGAQGLLFSGSGTANMTLTATDSKFSRNFSAAFHSDVADSATVTATLTNGTMDDVGGFLNLGSTSSGNFTFTVSGFTAWLDPAHTNTTPIGVLKGANSGVINGTISSNTFGDPAIVGSSGPCSGCPVILVTNSATASTQNLTISGNTVHHSRHGFINVTSGGSSPSLDSGQMNVKIINNTIGNADEPANNDIAIVVISGTDSADTSKTCAQISGNTIGTGYAAVGLGGSIRMRNRFAGTQFRIPGYAGSGTDTSAVAAYVSGLNGSAPTTATINGNSFGGGANCF